MERTNIKQLKSICDKYVISVKQYLNNALQYQVVHDQVKCAIVEVRIHWAILCNSLLYLNLLDILI